MTNAPTLREALERAVETLASSRHLLQKYAPKHHWLPEHDARIAELKAALSAQVPEDELIERCARAVWRQMCGGPLGYNPNGSPMRNAAWEDYDEEQHEDFRQIARSVLEAADRIEALGSPARS